jgi:methylmalonyl-CoA carboxyltransferase large subunit
MEQENIADILGVLEQIRAQIAGLTDRVATLEGKSGSAQPVGANQAQPAGPEPATPEPAAESISEEILMAISAGVAAFFGERVRIRQIRVVSSPAWAQQGRVWIQASHRLH